MQAVSSKQVDLSAARPATLKLADGPEVQVPAHAVSGSGTLAGSRIQPPAAAPRNMTLAGPTFKLEVVSTHLKGKVKLTLPVPPLPASASSGPDAALLAYYSTSKRAWIPVPAAYDPAAHTLTAITPHLSIWTVLRVDTGKLLVGATSLLKGFLDISSTTGQPSCPGHDSLSAAGITTASDKGDLAKWCAGVASGQPLLRVADNRHYAVEADYPPSWQASHVGDSDPLTSQILDDVDKALSPAPAGGASAIIPGGETEQFTVPAGTAGQVGVQPSSEAYLVDALLYGAQTLSMVMDDLPGAPASNVSKTSKVIKLALESEDCAAGADHLLQDKITSAATAGQYFRDDVDWAVGCLGKEWEVGYGLSGAIGSFVVSVVLWFADGIRLVVDGVKALIDSVVYWRSYRIAVGSPAADGLGTFLGYWGVHDGGLCLGSALPIDGPGSKITKTPSCSGTSSTGWTYAWGCNFVTGSETPVCSQYYAAQFTSNSDGSVTGTITGNPVFVDQNGNIVKQQPSYFQAFKKGDTFTLKHAAAGLLSVAYSNGSAGYFCNYSTVSAANQPKCGA